MRRRYLRGLAACVLRLHRPGVRQRPEPCDKDAFADSSCAQAWQWGLDKVVDVHGNAMVVNWQQKTNYYASNKKFKSPGDAPGGRFAFRFLNL
jgi:hypothetical protein